MDIIWSKIELKPQHYNVILEDINSAYVGIYLEKMLFFSLLQLQSVLSYSNQCKVILCINDFKLISDYAGSPSSFNAVKLCWIITKAITVTEIVELKSKVFCNWELVFQLDPLFTEREGGVTSNAHCFLSLILSCQWNFWHLNSEWLSEKSAIKLHAK